MVWNSAVRPNTEAKRTGDLLSSSQHMDSFTDKNLYAYCDNNPIMRKDDDGEFWHIIAGAGIGAAVEIASQLIEGKKFSQISWGAVGVSAGTGAVTAATGIFAGAAVSGVSKGLTTGISEKSASKGIKSGAVSAGLSLVGGTKSKAAVYGVKKSLKMSKTSIKKALKPSKRYVSRTKTIKKWFKTNFRKKGRSRYRSNSILASFNSGKLQILYSGYSSKRRR